MALRQQVEERLAFFETGAAPGKNADAIRKVLDELALDEKQDEDEEMDDAERALPLAEAEPPKKHKKEKKRKLDEMDEDEEDGEPVKKVKLSKEEKKALKKEKKRERERERMKEAEAPEAEAEAEVSHIVFHPSPARSRGLGHIFKEGEKRKKEGREGKGEEGKEEQTLMTTSTNPRPFFPPLFSSFVMSFAFLHICNLCSVHVISPFSTFGLGLVDWQHPLRHLTEGLTGDIGHHTVADSQTR